MFSKYTFKNFFSFRDETTVSFAISDHVPDSYSIGMSETGKRLSKALAVLGPNASGKTNLLKPLVFIHWFVNASFHWERDLDIPLQGHVMTINEPSEFEAEFNFDGFQWRYKLIATPERVIHESLYKKTSRFGYVFVRDWNKQERGYDIKQKGFGFTAREAKKVRKNASLISTAAQYGVELAVRLSQLVMTTNIDFFGRNRSTEERIKEITKFYKQQNSLCKQAVKHLKKLDLGLIGIKIKEVQNDPSDPDKKMEVLYGIHESKEGRFALGLIQESSGTQAAFSLLSKILPVLRNGGVAIIDELEADLHPHMIEPIMDLFFNERSNPHNAQIIFTCHAAEVLNELHKSQVVLIEKDENQNSHAWRLDSVKGVRADDNLYAKYMSGAYSAVPNFY